MLRSKPICALLGVALLSAGSLVHAAAFTPGNLVVYRVGTGTGSLVNTGNPVFLDEYTTGGTLVQSIALPTAAAGAQRACFASGTATSEGALSRSVDGNYLIATCYAATAATSLSATTGAAVNRVVLRAAGDGSVDTSTALADFADANNPRGATSTNGTDIWVVGGAGGIRYTTLGASSSTQLSTTVTNLRTSSIFGGQLYVSTSSGTAVRVGAVGTGTPLTSGQTITNLPGFPTAGSPYAFVLLDLDAGVAGVDTLYVADDGANVGIQKYSLVGGAWTLNGNVAAATAVRGLTASVSGGIVSLFGTTGGSGAVGGGSIYAGTDATGYNAAPVTAITSIATASANTAFRGIAFAPGAPPADTAPSVTSTLPANAATGVAANTNITINFSEAVNASASAYTLSCGVITPTFVVTGNGTATHVINPDADLPASILCSVNVVANQITDVDANDPPDNLAADFPFSFTTAAADLAPSVTATVPANGASSIAVATNITVSFDEPVNATASGYTIVCGIAAQTYTLSGNGTATHVLDPTVDLPGGAACTVTAVANQISDVDAADPPNNLVADFVFTFNTVAPPTITRINAVQGAGTASPLVGQTVTIEGIVVGSYQAQTAGQLRGFFVQEENSDADADPLTSEGLFVFCSACPVAVVEGQRVQVTGAVSEFFNMTQITASTAPSVVVVDTGYNLALATPSDIDLPIAGDTAAINAFYEAREGMRVRFTDVLSVSEYFELARYGQLILYANARPFQFTEDNAPSVSGFAAHIAALAGRRVILDDTDNRQNVSIDPPDDGTQRIYHPIANGGLSAGTQGADFFRGGDTVSNLTGVLHWSFAGQNGTDAWRIRPTAATPATFTPVNTRPATAPNPTGLIRAASVNVLNFFTTIDTTASTSTGVCGATAGGGAGTLDCRGADSAQELTRQRDRTTTSLCGLGVDLIGLVEIENTPGSNAITTVRDDLNARCGGANPWAIAGTDGTIGSDAIRVAQIYRSGRLNPLGSPLFDTDPIHNRPPMAQTYELVGGPQAGQRFTAAVNHFKSKGCGGATGLDLDQGDGQGCFNAARTSQANRLLAWVNGTVIPAAGNDPDVLLLGDFNAYGREAPITAITSGGYIDLLATFEPDGYSYLFDGQLGHLDYVFASASLAMQVMGATTWHINADEVPLFDYNDDIRDIGEAAFEEEPNGASRTPPRLLFEAGTPYRASDHDPVVVGVFGLPPTISAIADRTGLQDTPITGIAFTIADPDGIASVTCAANVVVTSSNQTLLPNANIAISGAAQACSLTLTPAPGAAGTTTVTVRVTDASGLSVEETFDATFLSDLLFRNGFEPQSPGN